MTSVRDIMIIAILLFVTGISIYFAVYVGHKVNVNILTTPTFNNSIEATSVINHSDAAINKVDYIYLVLFIAFFVSIVVTGWFIGGESVAVPIYFFVVMIFGFVSVILQNVWIDMTTNQYISQTILSLPITNFILSHLGYFTIVMGFLGIIAMFAKPNANAGGF